MKKLLITAAAIAFATGAYATDLPNKKAAPAAPAAAPAASADNTISAGYGFDYNTGEYSKSTATNYSVAYSRNLGGGFSAGVAAGTSQAADAGALKQTIEAQAGYKLPVFAGFTAKAGAGIGQRFTSGANYGYYALRAGMDYSLTDNIVINAANYRYRNSFDAAYGYESQQVGTGLTYKFAKDQSVNISAARSYDKSWTATGDSVTVGYALNF